MFKKTRWQAIYRYICRSSKNPESLARGVGLGLFIGFLPAIGFQMILALFTAGLFNANRIVTVLGTIITNPLTAIPIGTFSLWLGDWILPGSSLSTISISNFDVSQILSSSEQLGLSYFVGCLTLSLISGIFGYGATKAYFSLK